MTALPAPSKVKLGLVIDLDTCVGCHACAVACKQWNAGGIAGPLTDEDPYGREPFGVWFNRVHSYEVDASFSPREKVPTAQAGSRSERRSRPEGRSADAASQADEGQRVPNTSLRPAPRPNPSPEGGGAQINMTVHFPRSCLHCETPACVTVCPTGASYKRVEDGIVLVDEDKCIGCKLCSWACPYGAREYSAVEGVMKKCTLCVDRIYNEHLDESERQPACVQACPTRARHFGDLGDPESKVSQLVSERGGRDLLPELGYKPVNKYLPPRPRRGAESGVGASSASGTTAVAESLDASALPPVLRWLDRVLSR